MGKFSIMQAETGNHRIELYVDEYMLISEKFKVDLSPSDKLKKKLKSAESKLKRIEKDLLEKITR